MKKTKLKLGTRSSQLAMWQAEAVKSMLEKAGFEIEIVKIETKGDKILDRTLSKIGSKGLFTEELEEQLLNGSIDIVQHSAKDVQSTLPDGLELIAYTERENAADVLVSYKNNVDLNSAVIGTSSTRRIALLKHEYPQITTVDMRGNLQTRFKKLADGQADAMVLAFAGVHRMGYAAHIVNIFDIEQFIPAVGQGSIALECSVSLPQEIKSKIKLACNHNPTELCLLAERSYLKTMEGGCSVPVFAHATITNHNKIKIQGGIVSLNGKLLIKTEITGEKPLELGHDLALKILAMGGDVVLQAIKNELGK